jgi:hypothetical protein
MCEMQTASVCRTSARLSALARLSDVAICHNRHVWRPASTAVVLPAVTRANPYARAAWGAVGRIVTNGRPRPQRQRRRITNTAGTKPHQHVAGHTGRREPGQQVRAVCGQPKLHCGALVRQLHQTKHMLQVVTVARVVESVVRRARTDSWTVNARNRRDCLRCRQGETIRNHGSVVIPQRFGGWKSVHTPTTIARHRAQAESTSGAIRCI